MDEKRKHLRGGTHGKRAVRTQGRHLEREAPRERGIQKGKYPREKNNPQQESSKQLRVKRMERKRERKW